MNFNQRRVLENLLNFAQVFGPAVSNATRDIERMSVDLMALAETVRRHVAPQAPAIEFLTEVGSIRDELLASDSVACALQWIWRETTLTAKQEASRLHLVQ